VPDTAAAVDHGESLEPEGPAAIQQQEELRVEQAAPEAHEPQRETVSREPESLGEEQLPGDLIPAQELLDLRAQLRSCLSDLFLPRLDVAQEPPRSVLRAAVAFGVDAEVRAEGQDVNAIGWLCWNGPCARQRILEVQGGQITPRTGDGLQESPGQLLAVLALSRVPPEYTIRAHGREFTVADLVEYEQDQCGIDDDLTLKLIGLAHFLDTDATWENSQGESWSVAKVLDQVLSRPVIRLSRDASLRLLALSNAIRQREKQHGSMDGPWLRAKECVATRQAIALDRLTYEISSHRRFASAADEAAESPEGVVNTLEWLVHSLSGAQLRDARVVQSVDYLTRVLRDNSTTTLDPETRAHGVLTLSVYGERVFGIRPGRRPFLYAAIETRQPR
jgi:hypothetical protein